MPGPAADPVTAEERQQSNRHAKVSQITLPQLWQPELLQSGSAFLALMRFPSYKKLGGRTLWLFPLTPAE